jgi:nucleoside-diphosphate-sugar epimerase
MRVLVTGGTGFIGAWTTKAIIDAGHDVRLLVRDPERVKKNLAPIGVDGIDTITGDVTDLASVRRALDGCDAVLHAAAFVSVDRHQADAVLDVNVRGAHNVLGEAADRGLDPIVHVSSVTAVFRPGQRILRADLPVAPSESAYGKSKGLAERFARALQAQGAPVVITYPGGVLGPAAGTALGEAHTAVEYHLTGFVPSRSAALQMLDVRDLAAIHAAVMTPGRGPRRFMCGGHYLTSTELAGLYREVVGLPFYIVPVSGRVLRSLAWMVDMVRHVVPINTNFSHEALTIYTQAQPTDDRAVSRDLGIEYRDPRDTLAASITALYEAGRIPRSRTGKLTASR